LSIERLLRQHTHILNALAAVEQAVAAAAPSALDLRAVRWRLTRELLLHLGQVEAGLYAPLRRDPATRAEAEAESEATRTIATQFAAHAQQWHSPPSPETLADYAAAFAALARRVRGRIDAEARFIARYCPFDTRLPGPIMPSNDLARIAWEIRRLIHGEEGAPIHA
jgi:hypothetical protein